MSDDNNIGTALWLVAGGAAGYAVGRWLLEPRLTTASQLPILPSRPASSRPTTQAKPRALAAGPSGNAAPIDPYAIGPSGVMQPIDPYADATIVENPTRTIIAVNPQSSGNVPITRPSQVTTSATPAVEIPHVVPASAPVVGAQVSSAFATSSRVRRFDAVFAKYRGSLPIEYVRALVQRESNGQPSVRAGSSIGLMQIVPVVLSDYNKRHGTSYRSEHLSDPATNVAIGCELLHLIIESYRKNHPTIRSLQPNWDSLDFVELLTFGWNAGHSEAGGVGRVARYLEGLGATDITLEQVSSHAKLAGASKHLSNPAKVAWCKSVAALYLRERSLRLSSPLV